MLELKFVQFLLKNWKVFAILGLLLAIGLYCKHVCDNYYKAGEKYIQDKWDADTTKKQLADAQAQIVQLQAAAKLAAKQNTATNNVVTKYIDRVKYITQAAQVIEKEVPKYVTQADDSKCVVPLGLPDLWNKQNRGDDSPPAPGINDTPSAVELTDIASEHGTEAAQCLRTEQQLISLQSWVRVQYNIQHPDSPLSESAATPPAKTNSQSTISTPPLFLKKGAKYSQPVLSEGWEVLISDPSWVKPNNDGSDVPSVVLGSQKWQ